ncbi:MULTISPECIES: sugar ABC transporter ATP-binding protein [Bacillota]|uniref:sugar ABC transporter ATP-binding protein n=1 Tax=Bacillota TaxID=1239 RepID=UPI003F990D8D
MNSILSLKNVSKNYSGVLALDNIDLDIYKGRIHAIVGANGAGKSTLIKIITGAVRPTRGEIFLRNFKIKDNNPRMSLGNGISAVYQELNLIPELTVYENIFYGQEIKKKWDLDRKKMIEKSIEILNSIGITMDVNKKIKDLGIGSRQTIEIAKALMHQSDIVLFDEPTASLTEEEANKLHEVIFTLKENGIAVIYVSHKLDEVFKISDTITVFCDGKHVNTKHKENEWYTIDDVIEDMVGKDILKSNQETSSVVDKSIKVLELKNVNTNNVHDINLELYKGEILSISGLLGSKRTEVLNAIFGIDKLKKGEIIVKGKQVNIKSPIDAIKNKIGFITEDRKDTGLFMDLSLRENTSIVFLKKFIKNLSINKMLETQEVEKNLASLEVKYSKISQKAKELSGGNQQKIAIGKWLINDLDIIIMDEPTRGVDVGAKEDIYRIMFQLARAGKSLLIVSSESEEIIKLSDRTLVMSQGKIVSEYKKGEITSEKILRDSAKFIKMNGDSHE